MPPPMVMGFAWYYENQWDKIRAVSEDKDGMAEKYSDWLAGAENGVKEMSKKGVTIHKVYIDYDQLMAWTGRKGLPVNSHTRTTFSNFLMAAHMGLTKDI